MIVFTKDGRYVITKVSDKAFFEKGIYYIGVFKRNDERTIYNVLYRDGKNGPIMMKRCAIKAITRDKEYDITKGTPKSEILYMSVNPNGEAEVLKIYFKPRPRLKKVIVDLDFSTLAIKGRQSQGNLFSRYGIHKIVLKERGTSTLGGQNVWFDEDVRRLNADGRGTLLGEFKGDDKIIVWTSKNQYYITGYDLGQHFPDETVRVSRYEADRIYSVCYYDRSQQYYYMKRFTAEMSDKMQFFLDEEGQADLVAVTERTGAKARNHLQGRACVAPCGRDRRGRIRGRQEPPRQGQAPDDLRRRRAALHRTRTAARTRTFGRRRRRRSRRYALRRRCFRRSARRFRQRCGRRCGGRFER